jgi:probable F420-dependent oxidoreductase
LELGLGAGWMRTDYDQSGISYDSPAVRVERFEEAVAVIKGLLEAEDAFSFSGKHYTVTDHEPTPRPVQRPRPKLILGGGARRVLGIAAREADIVGINVNLRSGAVGPDAAKDATPQATKRKVQWVKEVAGDRFAQLELNTLVGFVSVTDDPASIIEPMASAFGIDPSDAQHVPLALVGTIEGICEELEWRREEYGISYLAVQSDAWEAIAPVVGRLSGK